MGFIGASVGAARVRGSNKRFSTLVYSTAEYRVTKLIELTEPINIADETLIPFMLLCL